MLKTKIIAGIISASVVVATIPTLAFAQKDFKNDFDKVQTYISSSKTTMKEANTSILNLEDNISHLNNIISGKETTIHAQETTIAALKKQLHDKHQVDPLSNLLPNDALKKFNEIKFNISKDYPTQMVALINSYYQLLNASHWVNYWTSIIKSPPANATAKSIKQAQGLLKFYTNNLQGYQSSLIATINLTYDTNQAIKLHIDLPDSEKQVLNNTKLPSEYQDLWNQVLSKRTINSMPQPNGYASQVGTYRALALSALYREAYWTYLADNSPKNWTDANKRVARSWAVQYKYEAIKYEKLMKTMFRFV